MDSTLATSLFQRLFAATRCASCRTGACWASRCGSSPALPSHVSRRFAGSYSRLRDKGINGEEASIDQIFSGKRAQLPWRPRHALDAAEKRDAYRDYPMVTAMELREKARKPKRVKMLMRDFIEDSLYNPGYGYFAKQAVIFDPGNAFPFSSLASEHEFQTLLDDRYKLFEDQLDEQEGKPNETRQLWHTPTELFRPHYAEAMARYLITNYKLSLYPFQDLIIYELGAGNGTFMLNILDYIRDVDPEVYARTRYRIVEISAQLAGIQEARLQQHAEAQGHLNKVEIINQSILGWDRVEPAPCYIVCMEVIDNFGHDAVRYNLQTEEPEQSVVLIDKDGEFYEFWEPQLDPLAARYLRVRDAATSGPYRHPLRQGRGLRSVQSRVFGGWGSKRDKHSVAEYIPTRLLQFFDVLHRSFPNHRLLLSDFHSLPEAVPGLQGPVVQTRFRRRTISVSTPLVQQGYFDIFFPTDFGVMEQVYQAVTGRLSRVLSHEEFMSRWAYLEETRTRNGENPLLAWYKNASVLTTV